MDRLFVGDDVMIDLQGRELCDVELPSIALSCVLRVCHLHQISSVTVCECCDDPYEHECEFEYIEVNEYSDGHERNEGGLGVE